MIFLLDFIAMLMAIQMDESELKLAEWKKREDIVLQPDDFSLTNEMMLMFKKGKQ